MRWTVFHFLKLCHTVLASWRPPVIGVIGATLSPIARSARRSTRIIGIPLPLLSRDHRRINYFIEREGERAEFREGQRGEDSISDFRGRQAGARGGVCFRAERRKLEEERCRKLRKEVFRDRRRVRPAARVIARTAAAAGCA